MSFCFPLLCDVRRGRSADCTIALSSSHQRDRSACERFAPSLYPFLYRAISLSLSLAGSAPVALFCRSLGPPRFFVQLPLSFYRSLGPPRIFVQLPSLCLAGSAPCLRLLPFSLSLAGSVPHPLCSCCVAGSAPFGGPAGHPSSVFLSSFFSVALRLQCRDGIGGREVVVVRRLLG